MTSDTYILRNERVRALLLDFIRRCPLGDVCVSVSAGTRRSDAQNNLMWSMLGDISRQVQWHGQWLSDTDWKDMATAALKRQRVVPGIDGGFVVLGARTSRMKISEMIEVIDFLECFGVQHNVTFKSDPRADAPSNPGQAGETPSASVSRG